MIEFEWLIRFERTTTLGGENNQVSRGYSISTRVPSKLIKQQLDISLVLRARIRMVALWNEYKHEDSRDLRH